MGGEVVVVELTRNRRGAWTVLRGLRTARGRSSLSGCTGTRGSGLSCVTG